ncbi:MAG: dATP/dGTP diphosphohydrolase domain-containing protein [Draconibacterium sp.]|nr:dATP/dGTP diphosphohydrolase domain-containing protein [Draconibacterium sp.]
MEETLTDTKKMAKESKKKPQNGEPKVDTKKKFTDGGGLRFNEGKLRYDLVHPKAHEDMVKVLTMGAKKYYDRNWERGMDWSKVIESLKRHVAAFEKGEDYDPESGLLHMAHAACNVHFLNAYYYLFPQGDNRPKRFLNQPNIGLDIDQVICDFTGAWCEKYGIENHPESWTFDPYVKERFKEMEKNGELEDFYLSLKPMVKVADIPFEPHCYITARPVSTEITLKWLSMHNFPTKPVYTVPIRSSKVKVAEEAGVEFFIDDSYENFLEMNRSGITTYLFTTPQNKRFDVGHLRINSLKDIPLLQ